MPDDIALYVHWPFCLSLCPYCDFNSHVADAAPGAEWAANLVRELDHYASEMAGRRLTSVFFGGGTPSLMAPATVAAVLDRATTHWVADADLEVTLEANPTSTEAGRLQGFRDAGVNRISLGVQSLRDDGLTTLGRQHTVAEALAALDTARRLYDRVSFDLIYARPGQSAQDWVAELDAAIALGPTHLSVYQLTMEPGTRFHLLHGRGDLVLPDAAAPGMFEHTNERLTEAGLPGYEISNHAAPGYQCRHNLTYWQGGDFAGIGPGAHGRLTIDGERLATRQHRAPAVWAQRVAEHGHATQTRDRLSATDTSHELMVMGLRTVDGVSRVRFAAATSVAWAEVFDPAAVARLTAGGFVVEDAAGIRATAAGRQRLSAVIAAVSGSAS